MTISISPEAVDSVLLPDGWHQAKSFTTGASPFADGTTWFSFTEVSKEGRIYSDFVGPVSSIQSVKSRKAAPAQIDQIAERLRGRVENDTVFFAFGEKEFELWLGPEGWQFAQKGNRAHATIHGYTALDAAQTITTAVMGDLKTGNIPGRIKAGS
ncbi:MULTISPECIES: hypothetical protein [unclassified Streptomyces]|uniref:hypothetical protein n=1 Tax=unclassified Streptomyces TaxID=2593676 RepID=UPI00344B32BA